MQPTELQANTSYGVGAITTSLLSRNQGMEKHGPSHCRLLGELLPPANKRAPGGKEYGVQAERSPPPCTDPGLQALCWKAPIKKGVEVLSSLLFPC